MIQVHFEFATCFQGNYAELLLLVQGIYFLSNFGPFPF